MSGASGSAGTLTVTVGARTGPLEQGLRYSEDLVNRFSTRTQRAIEQLSRSSQLISHGFGGTDVLMGGMGRAADSAKAAADTAGVAIERAAERGRVGMAGLSRSIGTAAGGLLMLAGNSESAAHTIGGSLTRAAGAFLAGGPWAAGVSLIADGIAAIGRNASAASGKVVEMESAMRRMLEAQVKLGSAARASTDRRSLAERADSAGLSPEALALREERERTMRTANEQATAARARIEALEAERATLKANALLDDPNSVGWRENVRRNERDDRIAAINAELGRQRTVLQTNAEASREIYRAMREDLEDGARKTAAGIEGVWERHADALERIQKEGAARLRDGQAELDRRATVDAEKAADERYRLSQEGRERAFERADQLRGRNASDAQQREMRRRSVEELNRSESERLGILRASTDLERLQAQHRADFRREVERGVDPSMVLRRHAEETRQLLEEQAEQANRVAEATQRAADAEAEAAESVKRRAEAERRATDEQKRASTLSQYAGGYGPNAQARDAKAANRRLRKNLRHEANLKAEAASRFGPTVEDDGMDLWRTREQPSSEYFQKWRLDESGNLATDGWGLRHREKFTSPGAGLPPPVPPTVNPSAEDIYGPGGLGALGDAAGKLGAAGDKAKAAGEALSGASEEMKSAAGEITEGADRTSKAADDVATNVAAIGTGVLTMAEAIEAVSGELATLKQQLATAGYIAA